MHEYVDNRVKLRVIIGRYKFEKLFIVDLIEFLFISIIGLLPL